MGYLGPLTKLKKNQCSLNRLTICLKNKILVGKFAKRCAKDRFHGHARLKHTYITYVLCNNFSSLLRAKVVVVFSKEQECAYRTNSM